MERAAILIEPGSVGNSLDHEFFLSSCKMIELPSESRITVIRQTGEWIIFALNVTPRPSSRAFSPSRSSTSSAMPPDELLGARSAVANSARQPPPGRSYSVQISCGLAARDLDRVR